MSTGSPSSATSRRHFLRGVGVALALPWLESLPVFAQAAGTGEGRCCPRCASASSSSRTASSRRTGGRRAAARRWSWDRASMPMLPHREDMVFIRGLFNQSAFVSTSPHLGRMNLLSGAPISLDPNEIRAGTSMDQVMASAIGDRTAIPSLVLGIEPNELRLEDGLSMIYGSSLSWMSPTQAGDEGDLSGADVRASGRRRLRPRARSQHSRRGASGVAEPEAAHQPRRQSQAERILRGHPRHRDSGSRGPRRSSGSKAGSRRSRSRTCRGRRTSCRRTCRIT